MTASAALQSVADIESFIVEYYAAWGGTDEDRILSYYAENVTVQIPGTLMQGRSALREHFVRPFITAFPGNRHVLKNLVFGRDFVVVEFTFEAEHKGSFAGRAPTGAPIELPGCGVYECDLAKRQITAARVYFDVGMLLKQIADQRHPLRAEGPAPTGAMAEHLDLATVIAVSQSVSGEMVLEKLLDTLMRTAVKYAGAERALLILSRDTEQRIAAEATTSNGVVAVKLCDDPITGSLLPEAVLRHVLHTRENVILDDAAAMNPFSADPYIARRRTRSVFCLPLTNQTKLVGVLYLENNRASSVFAPARTAVLKLLASQAAISLENGRLYRDLAERESRIRRLVDANIIGIFTWHADGRVFDANEEFLRIIGYGREDLVSGRLRWTDFTLPEWRERDLRVMEEMRKGGELTPVERELLRKDGTRVPVLAGGTMFDENEGVAFVFDMTERKRAEQRVLVQHRTARILAEAVTVEEAMPKILQALCECLGWDLGAWWRIDRETGSLRCAELWRTPSVEAAQFEAATRAGAFPPGSGFVGGVWANRTPTCIPDVILDTNYVRSSIAAREGLHGAFAFPILLGGDVLGVIDLVSREVRLPDQDLLQMTATLGSQIGQFIERKRTEEALRLSEERYALALEAADEGHFDIDLETGEIFVSARVNEIYGYPRNATTAQRAEFLKRVPIHPDDQHRAADIASTNWDDPERVKRLERYSIRIVPRPGETRWIQTHAMIVRDAQGHARRRVGVIADITDRKRAEGLLAGEKDLLEMMARATPLPAVLDALCHIVEENLGSLCSVLLVDASGTRLEQHVAPSLPHEYRRAIDGKAISSDAGPCGLAAFQKEQVIAADLGMEDRWVEQGWLALALSHGLRSCWSTPIVSSAGNVLGTFALYARHPSSPTSVHRAVIERFSHLAAVAIERSRAAEALRESERESHLIVHTIPGLVATLTPSGEVDFVNKGLIEYCGQPLEAMKQWGTNGTVHSEDLPRVAQEFAQAMTTGEPYDFETRIRRFDDVYRWFQVRGLPLRDTSGQIVRWYVLLSDIDDRKRAESELRRAYERFADAQRVAAMSTLTASIAHEVNQPLSGIITNASTCLRMLDADPPNIDGARETAKRTIRDGHRASDVTARLRALFSRRELMLESMDLNEAIREVIALSSDDLQRNQVVLQQELAERLPSITGDRVQLQQVILNLIRNASEAMTGVDDRSRQLMIRTESDGDHVRVTVEDAGVGLEPQSMDKLFDPFYTTKSEGMGIGLSVSRSIVERHQGRLWARPNDGPGATFSFSVPMRPTA